MTGRSHARRTRASCGATSSTAARSILPSGSMTRPSTKGWFNHEKQYYSAGRPENLRVAQRHADDRGAPRSRRASPDWGGQNYTSAKIVSNLGLDLRLLRNPGQAAVRPGHLAGDLDASPASARNGPTRARSTSWSRSGPNPISSIRRSTPRPTTTPSAPRRARSAWSRRAAPPSIVYQLDWRPDFDHHRRRWPRYLARRATTEPDGKDAMAVRRALRPHPQPRRRRRLGESEGDRRRRFSAAHAG